MTYEVQDAGPYRWRGVATDNKGDVVFITNVNRCLHGALGELHKWAKAEGVLASA